MIAKRNRTVRLTLDALSAFKVGLDRFRFGKLTKKSCATGRQTSAYTHNETRLFSRWSARSTGGAKWVDESASDQDELITQNEILINARNRIEVRRRNASDNGWNQTSPMARWMPADWTGVGESSIDDSCFSGGEQIKNDDSYLGHGPVIASRTNRKEKRPSANSKSARFKW